MSFGFRFTAIKVSMVLTPLPPAAGETMEDLPSIAFTTKNGVTILVGYGHALSINLRDTGFTEVLLGEDIDRDLTPVTWDLDVTRLKDE